MAMNFFERQETARRKTGLLIFYFVVAVILIVATIYAVVVAIFLTSSTGENGAPLTLGQLIWNPDLIIGVTLSTLGVIVLGSAFKVVQLSSGGATVAEQLGGRLINPATDDLNERKLLNVVDEMAIASGTPAPPVYVIEEDSINAFAAGFSPNDAVIGVTRGCMRLLSRDELQGVIAHEFSHIFNGDMRLNIRLMGVLHGILLIALGGFFLVRAIAFTPSRSSRSEKGGGGKLAFLLLGVALIIVGYIGVFFGKLIKAAVSRQREFLADASAVQFTRNPDGIGGALKKIGGLVYGSRVHHPEAQEVSHMFFSNALGNPFAQMLATHPPLAERITRIDPSFDGRFPEITLESVGADGGAVPGASRFAESIRSRAGRARGAASPNVKYSHRAAVASMGAPDRSHLEYASAVVSMLPERVSSFIHEPFGARAVVLALVLSHEEDVRRIQLDSLRQDADPTVFEEMQKIVEDVDRLPNELRLPVAGLAVPALRQLSGEQYQVFRDNVWKMIGADRRTDLFEYALMRMLMRRLAPYFETYKPPKVRYRALTPLLPSCVQIVSTFAYVGHDKQADAEGAFRRGIEELGRDAGELSILSREQCGLKAFDEALKPFASASSPVKKRLLDACSACVGADGEINVEESELLRAVADALDCPLPPILAHAVDA